MPMTPEGLDRLVNDEGRSLMPYRDSRNCLTIGIGRCLDTDGISLAECYMMLDNDLRIIERDCLTLPWFNTLTDVRKDVIMMLRFNLGLHGLLSFKNMIAAIEREDWIEAGVQMTNSNAARQTGERYKGLANAFASNDWSPLVWDNTQKATQVFPWND